MKPWSVGSPDGVAPASSARSASSSTPSRLSAETAMIAPVARPGSATGRVTNSAKRPSVSNIT
jgi:hypothetical protein